MVILAIIIISLLQGIIGSILMANKSLYVSGSVAHCAYAGIGAALFFEFSTFIGALGSALVVGIILAFVKNNYPKLLDNFSMILWSVGMSIGILFTANNNSDEHAGHDHGDIESYLFGSLQSIEPSFLVLGFIFLVVIILFVVIYYKEILSIGYDSEFCKLRHINTNLFMVIVYILASLGTIFSMQISGLMLVLAMLSIPPYITSYFCKTLKSQIIFSVIISLIIMLSGLFIASRFNLNMGAISVIISVFMIVIAFLIKKYLNNKVLVWKKS